MTQIRRNNADEVFRVVFVWVLIVAAIICVWVAAALAQSSLPDSTKTPGIVTDITADELCAKGFTTKTIRNVTAEEKAVVYESYGLKDHVGACHCPVTNKAGKTKDEGCEIDHLVSLEIGGSNDQENLWPQSYCGQMNAHDKDKLENELHRLVCAKMITLQQAQSEISTDWVASFKMRCRSKGSCLGWINRR